MPKVAITGTNGFIGNYLAKKFKASGWDVVAMQRSEIPPFEKATVIRYNINEKFDENKLSQTDLLIHCAWQSYTKKNPDSDEINEQGTIALQEVAHRIGAKFVFISTLSAHSESISHYGCSKFATEARLDCTKDLTLKIGLVIGHTGGFFSKIPPVLKKMKIIPLIENGQQEVQILDIDDLFVVIMKSFEKNLCGIYNVAETDSNKIIELYKIISNHLRVNPIFINVPYWLVYNVMQFAEKIIPLPVNTENLKGLKQYRAFDTSTIQNELSIELISAKKAIEKIVYIE
jgi:nucleoside-diphosphate-sugar epimerase